MSYLQNNHPIFLYSLAIKNLKSTQDKVTLLTTATKATPKQVACSSLQRQTCMAHFQYSQWDCKQVLKDCSKLQLFFFSKPK